MEKTQGLLLLRLTAPAHCLWYQVLRPRPPDCWASTLIQATSNIPLAPAFCTLARLHFPLLLEASVHPRYSRLVYLLWHVLPCPLFAWLSIAQPLGLLLSVTSARKPWTRLCMLHTSQAPCPGFQCSFLHCDLSSPGWVPFHLSVSSICCLNEWLKLSCTSVYSTSWSVPSQTLGSWSPRRVGNCQN